MKKKSRSLFEETKIQMVMKIFNMSRNKAIEYIAGKTSKDGQKKNDGSKSDHIISPTSRNADDLMSVEELFEDAD